MGICVCLFVCLFVCLRVIFSFGMTSDHFVFVEQPIYLNLMRLFANILRRQPPVKGFFEYGSEEKVKKSCVQAFNVA